MLSPEIPVKLLMVSVHLELFNYPVPAGSAKKRAGHFCALLVKVSEEKSGMFQIASAVKRVSWKIDSCI